MKRSSFGFKAGDVVRTKSFPYGPFTQERWKVIGIEVHDFTPPLLALQLIDTGEGPPEYLHTFSISSMWCRKV